MCHTALSQLSPGDTRPSVHNILEKRKLAEIPLEFEAKVHSILSRDSLQSVEVFIMFYSLSALDPRQGGSQCVRVILLTRMISVGCEFCGARIKF